MRSPAGARSPPDSTIGLVMASRPRELGLLLLVWLAFALGWAEEALAQSGKVAAGWFLTPLAFAALLLLVHQLLVILRFRGDQSLLPMVGILSGIGLLVLNYLDAAEERAQFGWLALGLVMMLLTIVAVRDVGILQRYKYSAAALG